MKINLVKLVTSLVLPLGTGFVGSLVTVKEINSWYINLNKPSLVPPNSVFGPVWTILFVLMGLALYVFWNKESKIDKKNGFIVFGVQLILNFLWSYLFFGLHSPAWALVDILLLITVISITINMFRKVSKLAAWLLVPYLLWVVFATYLNFGVWRLN